MAEQFSQIQSQITNVTMTNVSITDALSDYVEPVAGAEPYVVVKDANGTVVETEQGNYEITNVSGNNVFTVNFKDDYALKQGYTYELHLQVQATDKAYSDFATSGYNATGEAATGTHAGQQGFYSNVQGSAKLNYTTSVRDHEEEYPMPVIQVAPNTLTITKSFVGLTQDQIGSLAGLEFTVKLAKEDLEKPDKTVELTLNDFIEVEGQGITYTHSIPNIAPGTKYYVQETGGYLAGYELTISTGTSQNADGVQGEFAATDRNTEKTVAFTNTYTPSTGDLSITKDVWVQGGEKSDVDVSTETFSFTVKAVDVKDTSKFETEPQTQFDVEKDGVATREKVSFVPGQDNTYSAEVTITGTGTITIKGLPIGSYTVTEDTESVRDHDKAYFIGAHLNGYDTNDGESDNKDHANVTPDAAGTAQITNNYEIYKTLTIKKVVTGEMGTADDYFDFKVTGTNDAEFTLKDDQKPTTQGYSFKLNNDGSVTLTHLKQGDTVTVTEKVDKGYTNKGIAVDSEALIAPTDENPGDYTIKNAEIDIRIPNTSEVNLGTVTFTNERLAVAPTGLESDHTAPYALMVTAAAFAGLALVGGIAARRIRRRREW